MTTLAAPPVARAGSRITFRRYRGLEDIPGMGAAIQALRTHAGVLEPIDVAAMEHRYTHLVHSDPGADCLVAEVDGRIGGYVRVEWHDLTDGDRAYESTVVVAPWAWGLGIGDAWLDWAESRLRELADANPTARRGWLAGYAYTGDAEGIAALEGHDYVAVRWDAEMLCPDLEAIAPFEPPDGYTIRTPLETELPAVFEMAVLAFAEHWGAREAAEQRLDDWLDDPRFRRDLVVVVWHGDQPAAFVANLLEPAADGSQRGLLDSVATHPDHRRRGLARAAITESLRRLRDAGATTAYLGVDTANHNRALALYESCGFHVVSGGADYRKPLRGPEDAR